MLLRLINDILDVSRLEADRVTFTFEECDVVPLCQRVLASVSQARKSENEFIFECDRESMDMRTDTQRLQQVIINLLSNADKFTRNGKITLGLKVDEKQREVLFSVSDTGTGIPLEKQKLVFERFEKLNEYVQGTGLGLSICKLTVEKWGRKDLGGSGIYGWGRICIYTSIRHRTTKEITNNYEKSFLFF